MNGLLHVIIFLIFVKVPKALDLTNMFNSYKSAKLAISSYSPWGISSAISLTCGGCVYQGSTIVSQNIFSICSTSFGLIDIPSNEF
jgi:hypothetical protein